MMVVLTLKETGKQFAIRQDLVQSITQSDEGVIVWIDVKDKIGYLVTESFEDIGENW